MQFLREYGLAGILADDMGLGKTLQTLSHILLEKEAGRLKEPALIVAPTSLMSNWQDEAARFTPSLKVLLLQGKDRSRHFDRIKQSDIVLTTYALLPRDEGVLLNHEFHLLILDESQYIKNIRSKATQIASSLKARHKLCLTGTCLLYTSGIMLYLLFFLLRDGNELATRIRKIIPLADGHKTLLLTKFTGVIRATVKGNLVVAIVQGALGGLVFWFLGIEAALLWGAIMSVLSLLPAGSGVIWVPVAIYFLATGAIMKGVILLVFGILVIGLIDNLLRPLLVGKDTQMPDYLVLISTLGGMALFGLNLSLIHISVLVRSESRSIKRA